MSASQNIRSIAGDNSIELTEVGGGRLHVLADSPSHIANLRIGSTLDGVQRLQLAFIGLGMKDRPMLNGLAHSLSRDIETAGRDLTDDDLESIAVKAVRILMRRRKGANKRRKGANKRREGVKSIQLAVADANITFLGSVTAGMMYDAGLRVQK